MANGFVSFCAVSLAIRKLYEMVLLHGVALPHPCTFEYIVNPASCNEAQQCPLIHAECTYLYELVPRLHTEFW